VLQSERGEEQMQPDQQRAEPRINAEAAQGTSVKPLSKRSIAGYCAAAGGTGFYYAFSSAALPLLIPSSNVLLLNLMSNTRSIEGTVVQPIIGSWSDRTWTGLGRRKPFMVVALPLSALFIALTPAAPGLLGIVFCIVLFSLFFNVAFDPYTALEADIAPPAQRPILNGTANTVSFFGQVGLGLVLSFGSFKDHLPPWTYVIVALVLLLSWLVTIFTMRERQDAARVQRRYCLQTYVRVLRAHRQAFRCLTAFFCYMSGFNVILVNLTPYATHVLHVSKGQALQLFVLVVLMIGLFTLPASWLATRVGIRNVLTGGMVVMAVGAVGVLMASSVATVIPWILVAGIGCGAVSSLTWPLLMQLTPAEHAGVFAGLKTSAESVSAFFSAFVAFAMISWWGYRSIFIALLLAIIASLCVLRTVREGEAAQEVRAALAIA
jgi:Na+/melibiose symporter-like transporter